MPNPERTITDHACDRLWWLMSQRRMWGLEDNRPPEDESFELPITREEFIDAVAPFMLKLTKWERSARLNKRDAFFVGTAIILAIEGEEVPEIIFTSIAKDTANWLRPFCRGHILENLNSTRAGMAAAARGELVDAKNDNPS